MRLMVGGGDVMLDPLHLFIDPDGGIQNAQELLQRRSRQTKAPHPAGPRFIPTMLRYFS